MKLLTSTALAILVAQNVPPLPQQSQPPMASVEGIVLRADNGDAIAKAQVTLSRQLAPPAPGQNPNVGVPVQVDPNSAPGMLPPG